MEVHESQSPSMEGNGLTKSYNLVRSDTPDRVFRNSRARNHQKDNNGNNRTATEESCSDEEIVHSPRTENHLGLSIYPDKAEV
jgi:hypothetical protein